jgi:hypothetical protein
LSTCLEWIDNQQESADVESRGANVEVYTEPDAATGRYLRRAEFGPGMRVPVVIFAAVAGEIAVADLMPRT